MTISDIRSVEKPTRAAAKAARDTPSNRTALHRTRLTAAPAPLTSTPQSQTKISKPYFRASDIPASQVLRVIRNNSQVFRDQIVKETGLSAATVNRQVTALLDAKLVRERADQAASGSVGRPRLPLEINAAGPLAVGIHIGLRVSSVTVHDALTRTVGAIQLVTGDGDATSVLESIGESAARFIQRWQGRQFLRLGIAIAGQVDEYGNVDHPKLLWEKAPVAEILGRAINLPVSVSSHVQAMAGAELQHSSASSARTSTLYFYGRETVGTAVIVNSAVHSPNTGTTGIGHLSYALLPGIADNQLHHLDPHRRGTLEDAVTDTAIVEAGRAAGLAVRQAADLHKIAASGDQRAVAIQQERARVLGAAVSLVSDIINPDRIVLGGQAFTDVPTMLPVVARSFSASTTIRRPLHISSAQSRVQQQAAGAVALDRLFHDPIAEIAEAVNREQGT